MVGGDLQALAKYMSMAVMTKPAMTWPISDDLIRDARINGGFIGDDLIRDDHLSDGYIGDDLIGDGLFSDDHISDESVMA